jgi:hypothetical protein
VCRKFDSTHCCRLFDWSNGTLHNGGNYILEVALHEYLLQVRVCCMNMDLDRLTADVRFSFMANTVTSKD